MHLPKKSFRHFLRGALSDTMPATCRAKRATPRTGLATVLMAIFCLAPLSLLNAQTPTVTAKTPTDLLEQVRHWQQKEEAIFQERLSRFRQEKSQQKERLGQVQAQLESSKAQQAELEKTFADNRRTITDLQNKLHEKSAQLGETFSLAQQYTGQLQSLAKPSLISMSYPERLPVLDRLATLDRLPTAEELNTLWFEWHRELTATGEIVQFHAKVVTPSGETTASNVTRIGNFSAFSNDQYLEPQTDLSAFVPISRQPSGRLLDHLEGFQPRPENQPAESLFQPIAIDPTGGFVLNLMSQKPNLTERIEQGGPIGLVIIGLGCLGLLITLERLITLAVIRRRILKQRTSTTPNLNNPLGRILAVYERLPHWDLEALEHHLDEAILRNIPPIERRVSLIKVLAGVAPLLGLLGTVVGMIQTFQTITLVGSGDPTMMAGGISAALVTTMLGLFVAVPLILGHALVNTASQRLIGILEEESAGYIALASESRDTGEAPTSHKAVA